MSSVTTTPSSDELLSEFHDLVHAGIDRALELDGHCKLYEGRIEFRVELPDHFSASDSDYYELSLACYVLGPTRHYEWIDTDPAKLFERATADVKQWIAELEQE